MRALQALLGIVCCVWLACAPRSGAQAGSVSVDPMRWVQADLVERNDGTYRYDHYNACRMKPAAVPTTTSETTPPDVDRRVDEPVSLPALVHVIATAPVGAISRDQFVALVQRMESVYLMSIGEAWQPGTTAMEMAQRLDCRPRPAPTRAPTTEIVIEVSGRGFVSTFRDLRSGVSSRHAETWPEAFRP